MQRAKARRATRCEAGSASALRAAHEPGSGLCLQSRCPGLDPGSRQHKDRTGRTRSRVKPHWCPGKVGVEQTALSPVHREGEAVAGDLLSASQNPNLSVPDTPKPRPAPRPPVTSLAPRAAGPGALWKERGCDCQPCDWRIAPLSERARDGPLPFVGRLPRWTGQLRGATSYTH